MVCKATLSPICILEGSPHIHDLPNILECHYHGISLSGILLCMNAHLEKWTLLSHENSLLYIVFYMMEPRGLNVSILAMSLERVYHLYWSIIKPTVFVANFSFSIHETLQKFSFVWSKVMILWAEFDFSLSMEFPLVPIACIHSTITIFQRTVPVDTTI